MISPRSTSGSCRRASGRPRSPHSAPGRADLLQGAAAPRHQDRCGLLRAGPARRRRRGEPQPEIFSSEPCSNSIADLPGYMARYFGSMINMDDPRHARIRRIVSRAFTPRVLRQAGGGPAGRRHPDRRRLIAQGPGDFVGTVAARLPVQVICDMMGIPRTAPRHGAAAHQRRSSASATPSTPAAAERHQPDEHHAGVLRLMAAGLSQLQPAGRSGSAASAASDPGDDLISALVNANVDGERLTDQRARLVLHPARGRRQRDHPQRHRARAQAASPTTRSSGSCCWRTSTAASAAAVEEIVRATSRRSSSSAATLTRDHEMNGHTYRGGRQGRAVLQLGQPGRGGVRRPGRLRHHPLAQPARRLRRTRAALLPRRPPGPARDHRHVPRAVHPAARTSAPTGEPDWLLSSFINGIKRLPYAT